jgi:hypothetical protein
MFALHYVHYSKKANLMMSWSETHNPGINTTLNEEEYCNYLSASCLQNQPGWDPTLETETFSRISPQDVEIFASEVGVSSRSSLVNEIPNFEIILPNYVEGPEYCTQWSSSKFFITELKGYDVQCSKYRPELYREFVVRSTDTNEIIHAYRLKDSYTLLPLIATVMEGGPGINYGRPDKGDFGFSVYSSLLLDDGRSFDLVASYYIDVLTGKIISIPD